MTDLQDRVARLLLPSSWWRTAAERLRAGNAPHDILSRVLAERDATRASESNMGARAAAALATVQRSWSQRTISWTSSICRVAGG
jgi:hypothetical protein